ncbi:MAG: hypothetical protein R2827_06020 [Bdellovibrionales bacterium]
MATTTPMIDIELDNYLSPGCSVESIGQELKEFKKDGEGQAINIIVERTFTIPAGV